MKKKNETSESYLEEVTLNLQRDVFEVEGRQVSYLGKPLCQLTENGGITFKPDDVKGKLRESVKNRAMEIIRNTNDYYEMQQFQALCFAEEIGDVPGMINLSFDCQQVTVITDFTDLRQAGIDHCMVRNGGCASTEDIEAVEGYPEITSLIQQQAGKITPFGVLYANGMELSYTIN